MNNGSISLKTFTDKMGMTPVLKKSSFIQLKSDKGVVNYYNNGDSEGFFYKSSVKESTLNENVLRHAIEILLLLGIGITYFTTDITIIDGNSMSPTYKNHEIIIKTKAQSEVRKMFISKDTIVKFVDSSGTKYIKRILATPGDELTFHGAEIYVNGKLTDVPNLTGNSKFLDTLYKMNKDQRKGLKTLPPSTIKLKNDQYYVVGDNTISSEDSRDFGPIPFSSIISIIKK